MQSEAFLVFTEKGIDRLTKTLPNRLGAGQYAIRLRLSVPAGFFRVATPTVDLAIPESATLGPPVQIDLSSMEDVCLVETLVAAPGDDGNGHTFRCPSCGFSTWKKDVGPHYKPQEAAHAKK